MVTLAGKQVCTLAGKATPVNEIRRSTPMMSKSIIITPTGIRNHIVNNFDLFAFHIFSLIIAKTGGKPEEWYRALFPSMTDSAVSPEF